MAKKTPALPKVIDQRLMVRLAKSVGWEQTSGGRHQVKMEKEGERPVTLPHHKGRDYPRGLRSAILAQLGLTEISEEAEVTE
jgi:predicted RNA binding protein YcfA (HicA-like mRNA interferase family)